MKSRPLFFGRLLLPAAALISFSGSAPTIFAANLWDGGGGNANWTTALNWDDNNAATSGAGNSVFFGGVIGLNSINDYAGYTSWLNILFNSGAGSFNLTSATGANWDLYGKIENNSTNAQSVTIDAISLQSATANEFDATAGNLTITAKDIYTNGNNLTFWGAKTLTVINGGGGGISQGGKVILGSSFTGTAILTGSNAYTGNTEINSGTLKVGHSSGLGSSTVYVGNGGATGTAATLLLTGSGLSVTNNLNTNAGTNSNRTIGGDNTSGTNTFTGTLAMASGGSATLTAAAGGTVAFTGVISGTGQGITKKGLGTVTLSAANTYSGATTISGGILNLDFSAGGAPATNIVSSSSALSLGGGALRIDGATTVGTAQTFASTTFSPGSSVISAAPVSGANLPTVTLGALTFNLGGTIRFDGAATIGAANAAVAATATITTTTAGIGSLGVILGGANPFSGAPATVGLYDWASTRLAGGGGAGTSPYTIIGGSQVTGFYQATFGGNFDLTTNNFNTPTGTPFANTVRFNTAGGTTLVNRGILLVGGFLVTPNMGANNAQVTQGASSGDWQVNRVTTPIGNQEGVIWQNNTLGYFTLNQNIANGRDAGDNNYIVKAGDGTAVFAGTGNSGYVGQTYINGGNLVITKNSHLGALTTGAAVNLNGGTLFGNATFTLNNAGANKRPVTLLGNGGGLAASAGNTMTVDGVVSGAVGTGALVIGIPASSANGNVAGLLPGSGAGTANTTAVNATGTVALTGANSYTGGTIVKSGTVLINGIYSLGGANYGGLALDGGTLQYATAFTGNGSGDLTSIGAAGVTLASGNGTIDVNGNAVTYAGSVGNGGAGSLTVKSSAANGTLTLQGANTYTGGTTINSGTLIVNNTAGSGTGSGNVSVDSGGALGGTGSVSGAVMVASGGILTPGASVGTLTLGELSMSTGSILNFEFNANPANDLIYVSMFDGFTLNGGGFNLYQEGGTTAFSTLGTYNLIQFGGSIGGLGLDSTWTTASSTNSHVLNPSAGYIYSFGSSLGYLTLNIASGSNVGTWSGASDGNWSNAGNWTAAVGTMPPSNAGDSATLGTSAALRTVTLDANQTVGAVSFTNANSFVVADAGSTLTLDNSGVQATLSATDGTLNSIQTAVALTDSVTASVSSGKMLGISGNISNTSASKTLTVNGAGTLALSGNNTYGPSAGSVGTTLSAGTLQVGSNSALGAGDLAVTAASSLQAGGSVSLGNAIGITNGVTLTVDSQANTFTLGGIISDNAGAGGGTAVLSKIGNGTLVLNGVNTYGGGTTVTAGTLQVNSATSLGASTGNLTFNGGTLQLGAAIGSSTRNSVINSGKTAVIDTNSFDLTTTGVISSVGTTTGSNVDGLAKNGAGNLTLGTANTFTGQTVVNGGTLTLGTALALQTSTLNYASQGGTLSFGSLTAATLGGLTGSQALALTNNSSGNVALTVGGTNAATTFSGNLSGGGSFSKIGTATTTLSNASYSGNTVVYSGGLTLNGTTNLTTHLDISAQYGVASVIIDGATVNATGGLYITSSTGGSGTIYGSRATLAISNGAQVTASADGNGRAISYGATNTARPGGNGSLTIGTTGDTTTSVTANGALDMFYSAGGGTVGNFTVNLDGGTLAVQKIQETTGGGSQSGTFKFNGGVLKALQSTTTFLPAASGLTVSVLAGGAKINTNDFDVTVGASLVSGVAGDGGLAKTGGGALTLTGTNTYLGATAVSAGTLVVSGSIANSAVSVSNAGTVLASGATGIIGQSVTVNTGAILAAGGVNAVGTATVGSGGLDIKSSSIFEWDLTTNSSASGFDTVATSNNGNLTVASSAIFKVVLGGSVDAADSFWTSGTQTWNIFSVNGTGTTTEAISGYLFDTIQVVDATTGSLFTGANGNFSFNGSSLTWSAVPEPSSALVGLLVGAGLLRRRRSA